MDNLLKNLKQTSEAKQLISLLGTSGSDEYFKELLDKTGNFDDALTKIGLDIQTIPLQRQAGIQTDYKQLIQVIPQGMSEIRAIKNAPVQQRQQVVQQVVQNSIPQSRQSIQNSSYIPQTQQSFAQLPIQQNIPQSRPVQQTIAPQSRSSQNVSFTPSVLPVQSPTRVPTSTPTPMPQQGQIGTPNVVSPFVNGNVVMTQGIGERPWFYGPQGHLGEDYAYTNQETRMTNPIGGQVIENRYDPLYGRTVLIAGANPQEYNQMSPADRQALANKENNIRISHLAESPNINIGDYVGTGSAQLQMGSTGRSSGIHADIETIKKNQYIPFSSFYDTQTKKGKGGTGGGIKGIAPQDLIQKTVSSIGQAFQNIVKPVQQITKPVAQQISSTINYQNSYKPQTVSAPKPVATPTPTSQVTYQSTYKPQSVSAPYSQPQQSYSQSYSQPNTYVASKSNQSYTPSTSNYTPTKTTSTTGFQSYFAPTPVKSYSNTWTSQPTYQTQSYAPAQQSKPQSNNFFTNVVNQVKSWASSFGKRSSW